MAERRIYLDYNASTPVAPEALRAMEPLLRDGFGNPSSAHWAGVLAREALEAGRGRVADLLGCTPGEVVLTSGGSEANNAALKGAWFALRERGDHLVTTAVEHLAVLEPCRWLEALGARVTRVPVDAGGRVDPEDVRRSLGPRTVLVSVMHANNEVGTVQPLAEIARYCREAGVLLHTDAAQSVGKIPSRVDELGVDLLSLAGHKLCAPKGVGALYVREGTPLHPLIHGAGHEGGRRAGTESAFLAAGLGAACSLAGGDLGMPRTRELRDRFWVGLQELFGDRVVRNGCTSAVLPNTLHVSFLGRLGSEVLAGLPGVAASTGSACHSGRIHVSHVLQAMGVEPGRAAGAVRWSLGRETTAQEIDTVLEELRRLPRHGRAP
ncbi:MAG: cysteine desulfurase family protein [Deferrisomatales bacterium]|nr:cysteine desulfurase family protein [Deferrisomatales bacterium]